MTRSTVTRISRDPDLTVEQVAELLNVSTRTVRRRAHMGQIPAIREGRLLRFAPDAIDEYRAGRRAASA